MMPLQQDPLPPVDDKKKDQHQISFHAHDSKNIREELLIAVFGSIGLVGLTAVTITVCNLCMSNLANAGFPWLTHIFIPYYRDWITAGLLFSVIGLTSWIIRRQVLRHQYLLYSKLEEVVKKLGGETGTAGMISNIEVLHESLKAEVEQLQKQNDYRKILTQGPLLYSENTEDVLDGFLEADLQANEEIGDVRIVATAKGLVGKNSFSLAKHIEQFMEKRRPDAGHGISRIPFRRFLMVVPDARMMRPVEHRGYHFCARYFILDVMKKIMVVHHQSQLAVNQEVTFEIRFDKNDIFPAWHIWGKKRAIIVPSIGFSDNYNLAEALPVGIVISSTMEKHETDMKLTIERLITHFDENLFRVNDSNKPEKWTLCTDGSIRVENFDYGVQGDLTELRREFTKILRYGRTVEEYLHWREKSLTTFELLCERAKSSVGVVQIPDTTNPSDRLSAENVMDAFQCLGLIQV